MEQHNFIFLFGFGTMSIFLSWQEASDRLKAGNRRYALNRFQLPDVSIQHRKGMLEAQHPFAAILSCSDSRVPPISFLIRDWKTFLWSE